MSNIYNNDLAAFDGLPVIDDMDQLMAATATGVVDDAEVISSDAIEALKQSIERSKQKLLQQEDWLGDFSPEEIEAIMGRVPFLQICDSDTEVEFEESVSFIRASSGWLMHDYVHALAASPGEHMYNTDMVDEEDETGTGRSGVGMPPGVGTIIKQGFDTAMQMVELAKKRGWHGVYIVDGHRRMKWAAWVAAMQLGVTVYNFEPTERERDRLSRLRRNEAAISKLRVDLKSRHELSM